MRRIPTLFQRDPADRRFVSRDVTPGCEWVLAGQGIATRMYDGTAVLLDPELDPDYHALIPELQDWWVRVKPKLGGQLPSNFHPVLDGGSIGWIPADQSKFMRQLTEAVHNLPSSDAAKPGTHELIGPRINRDPEGVGRHLLIAHRDADLLTDTPRDFDGLTHWLLTHPYQGIVWQHRDGRMAKLKRKDVRRG